MPCWFAISMCSLKNGISQSVGHASPSNFFLRTMHSATDSLRTKAA